jgi:ketosteroid isomerase-like protein
MKSSVVLSMKNVFSFIALLILLFFGCDTPDTNTNMEQWKAEIMEVEKAFNHMAQQEGVAKAFLFYAADDGVIMRGNNVIKGKAAIGQWTEENIQADQRLSWKPSFVEVSQSGDLAYTYGDYTFSYPDTLGEIITTTGIFHTVWKRQADGDWKFVWD